MKVSVLIPAYQAGSFVQTALESVVGQTHEDWEIIVVEDGSHDGTEAIVDTFAASCGRRVIYRNMGAIIHFVGELAVVEPVEQAPN